MNTKSASLFERAKGSIPGGVNSPVRAFRSVGGDPVFMKTAKGAYLYDEDGNAYIDYINSWGPMILGHCRDEVVGAIQAQASKALSFGAPTELEIQLAELIKKMVNNIDMIRLVSSGTEACMSALRLARGYTGRNRFIKFEGCYHGHADPFLVKAGSGVATFNIQTVPGVTAGTASDTLTAEYNNIDQVRTLFKTYPGEIAAVITEPVAGNMGCVPPDQGFMEALRQLCDEEGALLIFDEVMTGFRLAPGGAQEYLGVKADLVTYGKVIGGGMPVGAFGGRQDIMEHIAPLGNVYQAGTLSGNPLAVTAGLTTLSILNNNPNIYNTLDKNCQQLEAGLSEIFNRKSIAHTINRCGSFISVFFGSHAVRNFNDATRTDTHLFNSFFRHMLSNGVYLPPSAYETWFLSIALEEGEINKTLEVADKFIRP